MNNVLLVPYDEIREAALFARVGDSVIESALQSGELLYSGWQIDKQSLYVYAAKVRESRDRPAQILRYIISYKQTNDGISPTLEEIKRACDLSSKSVVSGLLRQLADGGKIRFVGCNTVRNIAVVGGAWKLLTEDLT